MSKNPKKKSRGRERMRELGYVEARYWVTRTEKKQLDAAFKAIKKERIGKARLATLRAIMQKNR